MHYISKYKRVLQLHNIKVVRYAASKNVGKRATEDSHSLSQITTVKWVHTRALLHSHRFCFSGTHTTKDAEGKLCSIAFLIAHSSKKMKGRLQYCAWSQSAVRRCTIFGPLGCYGRCIVKGYPSPTVSSSEKNFAWADGYWTFYSTHHANIYVGLLNFLLPDMFKL